jgi:hypothetical protein
MGKLANNTPNKQTDNPKNVFEKLQLFKQNHRLFTINVLGGF